MSILRLSPAFKDYLWGGFKLKRVFGKDNHGKKIAESWEASVHPDGLSTCNSTTLAQYLKTRPGALGTGLTEFPILVKYIDANQKLSVQVHPDDEFARRVENDNGKTEAWYIVTAERGAGIYCGFNRDTSKEEFLQKLKDGTVEELLNFIPAKAGECILIEAGTVHAIGAGCVICEIQQSSNVTYRVYDYDRKDADGNLRPLHVDKAVQVINYNKFVNRTGKWKPRQMQGATLVTLTQCKYFTCSRLTLNGHCDIKAADTFTILNVVQGAGNICGINFTAGNSFFITPGEEYYVEGKAKIILTTRGVVE